MRKQFKKTPRNQKRGGPMRQIKSQFTDESFKDAARSESKGNDASYYNHNPALLQIAGKFSFGNALGGYQKFGSNSLTGYTSSYLEVKVGGPTPMGAEPNSLDVPGIFTLEMSLVPGYANGLEAPVNIAARNLYTAVRREQTGTLVFDAPDLMMFCLMMDNLNCYYTWMQRLYGIMNNYTVLNRYTPDALIKANHVDPVDLRAHLADLQYYMEQFAVYVRAYPIPKDMPYFKRHAEMFANVYKDGHGEKAQLYMFVPFAFWAFNETFTTADPGQLDPRFVSYIPSTPSQFKLMTFEDIVEMGDSLLTGLISSQDAGTISAALLKAFGYDSYAFGTTPPTYTVQPVYNEEILMQIHNARAVGPISSNSSIYQTEENQIIFEPALTASVNTDVIVDCAYDNPTPEEVMAMTRFTAVVTSSPTSGSSVGVAGAEIVNRFICYKSFHSSAQAVKLGYKQILTYNRYTSGPASGVGPAQAAGLIEMLADISKFDWSPILEVVFDYQANADTIQSVRALFNDFENYTIMQPDDLRKLNEVALLSLFGVPRN
nr:capsid protein [Rat picobirnavirus]